MECSCVGLCKSNIFWCQGYFGMDASHIFPQSVLLPLNRECRMLWCPKLHWMFNGGILLPCACHSPFGGPLSSLAQLDQCLKARLSKIQGLRVIHTSSLYPVLYLTGKYSKEAAISAVFPPRLLASQQCTLLMSGRPDPPPSLPCLGGPPSKQGLPG